MLKKLNREAGLLATMCMIIAFVALLIAQPAQAHVVTKQSCVKYALATPGTNDYAQYRACWRWAKRHNESHGLQLPVVLNAIRACESGKRSHGRAILGTYSYTAQNPHSTASGAYQYLDSTWGNLDGYAKARYAPRAVQDARALRDFKRGTAPWQFGDWRRCWGVFR